MSAADALLVVLGLAAGQAAGGDVLGTRIQVDRPGEVAVVVRGRCASCSWGAAGREAAVLRVSIDGRYSQHLVLAQGDRAAEYPIALGALPAGRHALAFTRDDALSAPNAGPATVSIDHTLTYFPESTDYTALARAPILYARPNTVGKFTDLPILMWYEIVPTARGRQFRYSVVFTNEDGGTATDRLMATGGRTTDIEYVYGVELDLDGRVLAEEFQGPGHAVPPFTGQHEGLHPLLWVSTDNNMVSESGPTSIRYALLPERVDLTDVSREAVMDRHAWSYALASEEMSREGKIGDAAPGHNTIPDPRRYVYVEACGEVGSAAIAFALSVRGEWISSDRGLPQYRIVRDGCFRAAVPLPAGAHAGDVRALRVRAFTRPSDNDAPAPMPNPVRITRVNTLFVLDEHYRPGAALLRWTGAATIAPDGDPFDLPIK